jgi:hypothetical protein
VLWLFTQTDFLCYEFVIIRQPFKAEPLVDNIYVFSPYLKENTTLQHYKDQLGNAVQANIHCSHWESHATCKQDSGLLVSKGAGIAI